MAIVRRDVDADVHPRRDLCRGADISDRSRFRATSLPISRTNCRARSCASAAARLCSSGSRSATGTSSGDIFAAASSNALSVSVIGAGLSISSCATTLRKTRFAVFWRLADHGAGAQQATREMPREVDPLIPPTQPHGPAASPELDASSFQAGFNRANQYQQGDVEPDPDHDTRFAHSRL